jgi:hypothetical protein
MFCCLYAVGDQDVVVMSSYMVQWFENTGDALLFSSTPYTISGNTYALASARPLHSLHLHLPD